MAKYYDNWEIKTDIWGLEGRNIHVGHCPNSRVSWKITAKICSLINYWSKQPICIKTGKKVHKKTCINKNKYDWNGKWICKNCEKKW